jgi:hypothetical protein
MRGLSVSIVRVFISAAVFGFAAVGGCSASGNDVPVDPIVVDGGEKRNVINANEGDGGVGQQDYDARSLFDSGSSTPTDGAPKSDSSTSGTACGYVTSAQGGTCAAATDIGQVSGDTNPSTNTVTFQGKGSQWLFVNVTEDKHGLFATDLKARIKLTAPSGANYDLFAFVDPGGTPTTHSCSTASGQSNNAAGVDEQVDLIWKDNKLTSDSDDTRLVSIQVDWVSGPCGTGDEWTVTVEGNPQ